MYYRYQPECGERVKKQDEVASHLHWKYKLNVHFPTLLPSITQVSCMLWNRGVKFACFPWEWKHSFVSLLRNADHSKCLLFQRHMQF